MHLPLSFDALLLDAQRPGRLQVSGLRLRGLGLPRRVPLPVRTRSQPENELCTSSSVTYGCIAIERQSISDPFGGFSLARQ